MSSAKSKSLVHFTGSRFEALRNDDIGDPSFRDTKASKHLRTEVVQ